MIPTLARADRAPQPARGLRDVTVLIIRHAERPPFGKGLSARGAMRATAYAEYFDPLVLDGASLKPQRLIATRDSRASARPRLTLTPLADHLSMPIEQPWADRQVGALAQALRANNRAAVVLIAWHHGQIAPLIAALGGDARSLLGRRKWPGRVYDWLVVLHFDHQGQVVASKSRRVAVHLLAGDAR